MPAAGIFIMGDTSRLQVPAEFMAQPALDGGQVTRDWALCRWLTTRQGVAAIPPSAFYCEPNRPLAANFARWETARCYSGAVGFAFGN
jgi:hypothetical protein